MHHSERTEEIIYQEFESRFLLYENDYLRKILNLMGETNGAFISPLIRKSRCMHYENTYLRNVYNLLADIELTTSLFAQQQASYFQPISLHKGQFACRHQDQIYSSIPYQAENLTCEIQMPGTYQAANLTYTSETPLHYQAQNVKCQSETRIPYPIDNLRYQAPYPSENSTQGHKIQLDNQPDKKKPLINPQPSNKLQKRGKGPAPEITNQPEKQISPTEVGKPELLKDEEDQLVLECEISNRLKYDIFGECNRKTEDAMSNKEFKQKSHETCSFAKKAMRKIYDWFRWIGGI